MKLPPDSETVRLCEDMRARLQYLRCDLAGRALARELTELEQNIDNQALALVQSLERWVWEAGRPATTADMEDSS